MQVRLRRFPTLAIVIAALWVSTATAGDYVEGKDFVTLGSAQPTSTGDKVEVIEFFSYGCPHCAHFEPVLDEWLDSGKPDNVQFRRVPVAWNKGFEAFARVYYAAQMLDAPDEAGVAIFHLLHEEKPPQLTLEDIADLYAKFGVDRNRFMENFASEAVTDKVVQAKQLTRQYRVAAVPTLIVDGAYQVPSPAGGDFKRMLDIADYLAAKSAE
jgi:thiol:disulfide interchange protein DsbA